MARLLQITAFFLFASVFQKSDCSSYHVAFLGRNQTLTHHVGTFLYPALSNDPVITSHVENCTSYLSSFPVSGTSFMEVMISKPPCTQLIPNGVEKRETGIKIESPEDFVLHVYQTDGASAIRQTEGYLAIPDEHLGNEYYVVTYCALGGYCQFAVAGITNESRFKVIFPDSVPASLVCVDGMELPSTAPSGSPVSFEVNEYQVLHFESEEDLTGTYIYSDQNVAVFAGARDVPTSTDDSPTTAYLIEQLPPVNKWGYSFIAAPNYLNDAGDIVKLIAKSDDTIVEISGFSPFKISKRGGYMERRIDWKMHSHIETSNPVMIVQIMSINIYNETRDVTGTPSMVLVPHVEQWTTSGTSFYCSPTLANQTLIAVVTDTVNSYSVPVLPTPSVFYSSWTIVDGTDYSVQMFEPLSGETTIYGLATSSYGYCDGSAALLLNANWAWENEDCVPTVVSPGDNVDNDCDGQVDEDSCQGSDLVTGFTSTQNNASDVLYKSLTIQGVSYVSFTLQTCGIAMVTLQTTDEPVRSISIQISKSSILTEVCDDVCLPASVETKAETDCTIAQSYLIQWSSGVKLYTGSQEFTLVSMAGSSLSYDLLTLSAYTGSAEFNISLMEKDCKKVPRVFADNLGSKFILPVHDSDIAFMAFLSTPSSVVGKVTVRLDVEYSLGVVELNADETVPIKNTDITENNYDKITLTALGGEISVFLMRWAQPGIHASSPILPVDILGTSYNIYNHSESTSAAFCDVFAVDYEAHTNVGNVSLGTNLELNQLEYDELGTSHLIKSDRRLAIFCGTLIDTQLQIPPVETLGKQFYIPAIILTNFGADAVLVVLATEDNTVVTIRGDYDMMDIIGLKGETITRSIVSNTTYNILSTKPVHVHLQIRSTTINLASDVFIPAVDQYKKEHVFPGFVDNFVETTSSFATCNDGNGVSSLIPEGATSVNAGTYVYAIPTFTLTVMRLLGTDDYFIIPSDIFYNDINEVCIQTTGTPGDGIDNDCDGLIDEEQCSDTKVPGAVDYDIDGSLNEDCAVNTSTTTSILPLSIPSTMMTCTPTTGNGSSANDSGSGGIDISGTNSTDESLSLVSLTPKVSKTGTSSPFEPFRIVVADIIFPTTTPAPGSTAPPVETCRTECVCPCGWVMVPQNYTKEELEASVIEIQDKLKVKKNELSASIRKKTSATDDRTSATAVGYAGLAFLVVTLGTVAVLDITSLLRDVKTLAGTIINFFKS